MRAEIVSVGTELLLGMIADTNAQHLSQQLADIGVDVYWISQVGDNLDRVAEVFERALNRSDAVIVTGGLGPTEDDLTREAIAKMLGETMTVDSELEKELRENFARRNRPMPERNIKQATLIPSASALPNPIGTAPGWWVECDGRVIACMPGVPAEMRLMWDQQVRSRLRARAGTSTLRTTTLRVLGIGEGQVEEQLGALVRLTNPTVATYAKIDGVQVRVSAKAADEATARSLIAPVAEQVREILGPNIFGGDEETLGALVADQLLRCGWGLASVELGTAGALAAEINDDGALQPYFRGGFLLAPDGSPFELDGLGAVEMAMTARLKTGAEAAVAVVLRGSGPLADYAVSADEMTGTGTTNFNRGLPDLRRRASIEALALLLRVLREAE